MCCSNKNIVFNPDADVQTVDIELLKHDQFGKDNHV